MIFNRWGITITRDVVSLSGNEMESREFMDKSFLSGLEAMGLGKMSNIDLFSDQKEEEKKKAAATAKAVVQVVNEEDYLLLKGFTCPVCDHEFKGKTIKAAKMPKLVSRDPDLRCIYSGIDVYKYGVVCCPICGYASMAKSFGPMSSGQMKLIREQISASFTGLGVEPEVYTYDDALARYKLALVNSVVKRAKLSERAYLCLHIAWLLRGKRETLPDNTPKKEETAAALQAEEQDFLCKARDGLMDAYSKESFPMCGMDEATSTYLIAALCGKTGQKEEALRWASKILGNTMANSRIKDLTRNLKELITNGEL